VKKTTEATPAAVAASLTAIAAAAVMAIGLSNNRCFPAFAATTARSACIRGGTANATASTSESNASKSS